MRTNAASSLALLLGCMDDARLAREAARALGRVVIDDNSVIPALTNDLHSESSTRRVAAAVALGSLGHRAESAVPALNDCVREGDPALSEEAKKALINISRSVPKQWEGFAEVERSMPGAVTFAVYCPPAPDSRLQEILMVGLYPTWVRDRHLGLTDAGRGSGLRC